MPWTPPSSPSSKPSSSWRPSTSTALAGDKLTSFLKLVDLLEDNDDVQNVWHNGDYEEPED